MRPWLCKTCENPENIVRTPVKAEGQIQTALVGLELGRTQKAKNEEENEKARSKPEDFQLLPDHFADFCG